MPTHLELDLAHIKRQLLAMGALAEEALRNATVSVTQREEEMARAALDGDVRVDELELAIDDQCIKCLALYQPVAGDLRFLTAAMKMTTALERIGDLAGNIAKRALGLLQYPRFDADMRLDAMAEFTRSMLHDVLDAFVTGNTELAREVCARDDEVDAHNKANIKLLIARMKANPADIEVCVSLLTVSRAIERVADHTTNIAEDVVFLVEALDIRHPSINDAH